MGCVIAVVVTIPAVCAIVAVLHFGFDAFLVAKGVNCEGCFLRERRCAGILLDSDIRDGVEERCLGVPVGAWYCSRLEHDRYVRVPCPQ